MSYSNDDLARRIDKVENEVALVRREIQENHEVVIDFLARMDTYAKMTKWFFRTPIGVGIMWGIYKLGILGLR